ncbi:hypothetical protein GCM10022402_07720 [Salinactinospora qingdaonensis]|uniref:Uncharacterized protein n=1 Tax=Salinactinospora qingdaonensis TaxID=702744 RepID=A0ABP7F3E8_9ACTN
MPSQLRVVLGEVVLDLGQNPPLVLSQSHCTLLGLRGASLSYGVCLRSAPSHLVLSRAGAKNSLLSRFPPRWRLREAGGCQPTLTWLPDPGGLSVR